MLLLNVLYFLLGHSLIFEFFDILATCVLIKHGDLMVANLGDGRAVASVHNMPKQLTQVELIILTTFTSLIFILY